MRKNIYKGTKIERLYIQSGDIYRVQIHLEKRQAQRKNPYWVK